MEIIFAKEYLKELQLTGKTSDKRYRFQPDIIKRYRRTDEDYVSICNIIELSNHYK